MKELTLDNLTAELHRLDPKLDPDEDAYKVALTLLSCLVVGPSAARTSRFTGFDRKWTDAIFRRLRRNGVVSGGQVRANWFEEETGGIAFWCDVLVGQGLLSRVRETQKGDSAS